jgi:sulfite reductase beta subunit-like hemoprotein
MGDLTAEQMLLIADLADRYSNGNIRTTINQNMIIRWIPESRITDLYTDLATQGLADPGAELVLAPIHAVWGSRPPRGSREPWQRYSRLGGSPRT